MMVGLTKERIMQGLAVLAKQSRYGMRVVQDYDVPNVSEKVMRIIVSYTDYVRRTVWGVGDYESREYRVYQYY